MLKKKLFLPLIIILALALTGCNTDPKPETTPPGTEVPDVETPEEGVDEETPDEEIEDEDAEEATP